MKYLLTLIVIVYSLCQGGCTLCTSKKVTCPAFKDSAFFKWFPYKENQHLVYKDLKTGDTLGFAIASVYKTPQTDVNTGGYGGGSRYCVAEASISAVSNNNTNSSLSINYQTPNDLNGNNTFKGLYIYLNSNQWYAGAILDTTIEKQEGTVNTVETIHNVIFENGITYPQLLTFTQDTTGTKEDKPYKLYIAKNTGIVGFEMYPSKQKWILQ